MRSGGSSSGGPGGSSSNNDGYAEYNFRRRDQNGDGLLNYDEMSDTLQAERDRWDANKDGFIDLNEYKGYSQARMAQREAERANSDSPWGRPGDLPWLPPAPIEEDKKPVVYKVGNLPKELPAWFKQYDTDPDAQIGLYEWKSSGRALEEFFKMDRNGDGFLTVEETLFHQTNAKKDSGADSRTAATGPRGGPPGGGPPGPPGGSFGGSRSGGPGSSSGNSSGSRGPWGSRR
jgi:hypothetical protein